MTFHEGEVIAVPCTIQCGPFPHEKLISVETTEGPFWGFADKRNLHARDAGHGYLKGTFVSESDDSITVRLFGEFFRTAMGLAYISRRNVVRFAEIQ